MNNNVNNNVNFPEVDEPSINYYVREEKHVNKKLSATQTRSILFLILSFTVKLVIKSLILKLKFGYVEHEQCCHL